MKRRFLAALTGLSILACVPSSLPVTVMASEADAASTEAATDEETRAYIEETLNLANNEEQTWTYSADADAWTLSVVSAVVNPILPDQQGVSVCVPGPYVTGIDTDGDGVADVTADTASGEVKGSLVIDYDAQITSPNGQTYTAATAPVILNTGAAGYGSQSNQAASSVYAQDGYINVACGNRGKQDTITAEDGTTIYVGDAPSCLVDQKDAARFVKYNILLGNLPGSTEYWISTGGSGGGAHATMFAATSNNPDFYNYEIEAGAVGVYRNEDGTYDTTITIDGNEYDLSDGAWGCVAYSAITPLAEGDMAMAFEYYLDEDYEFGTPFQKALAGYLSEAYMDYINAQELSVQESLVGFDLNGDGDQDDTINLTIDYDEELYPDTNGYGGTYLDLYLAEFVSNLQWYLDNLDYAEGWTLFDAEGNPLSDEEVAAMTVQDKAAAFLEGRYTKGTSGGAGGPGGFGGGFGGNGGPGKGAPGAGGEKGGFGGMGRPDGQMPDFGGEGMADGQMPDFGGEDMADGQMPDFGGEGMADGQMSDFDGNGPAEGEMIVGTPDAGTTQSASGGTNSNNYSSYVDMVAAYQADIDAINAGDKYGNDLVSLYNPLLYIDAEGTENPTWIRIMMGAAEGDMSMFNSLNLQLAALSAGIDANIEWQWDGGHVPSETLGSSLSLYVDQMYGTYVEEAAQIEKQAAVPQTENGDSDSPSGTDLTGWVLAEDLSNVSFSLADAASYRTAGANKAIPGFDVIDYGQEDYVFGDETQDARHWNEVLLDIFKAHEEELAPLF